MEKVLDKTIKYSLIFLVFLLPLWFLPWTVLPLVSGKQMLLAVFVFFLLILWLAKVIVSGKLVFNWGKLSGAVFALLLVLVFSTFFSSARSQSFWGMSFEPDTFFSFLLHILLFFLVANSIRKEEVPLVVASFLGSSGLVALLFLIQLFRPVFSGGAGFNTVGSAPSLAVFLGGAFLILLALASPDQMFSVRPKLKRLFQGLAVFLGLVLFAAILLVNFRVVWLVLCLGLAIIIFSRLRNSGGPAPGNNLLKPFFFPLLLLSLVLFLLFVSFPIRNFVSLPVEVNLTNKATLGIAAKTWLESPKNLVLGSGPSTFGYQYSRYRGTELNLTNFWPVRFDQGANAFLTFLTDLGSLGILVILSVIAIFFYSGFKALTSSRQVSPALIGSFLGGFYFLTVWFFYQLNPVLLFAAFLMTGLFVAASGNPKEFLFSHSSQKAFFPILASVILIVSSVLGIYHISRKYIAAIAFNQGLVLLNAPQAQLDEGIGQLKKALALDPKDVYFRNLSQAFLPKISEILNNQNLSPEQKQTELQKIVSDAELSAVAAARANPQNSQNWFQLGAIYENLGSVNVKGAAELATLSYQKAAGLDPQNPQLFLNLGRAYTSVAEKTKAQILLSEKAEKPDEQAIEKLQETYDKSLESALGAFKKSAELKNDFSGAYYLMAQVYETQGKKNEARENYQTVLKLEPDNKEVAERIREL